MSLFDRYALFQNPNLTPAEQAALNAAPDRTAGHITIALDRAAVQFEGKPVLPENPDVGIRFPGIDPMGKYSVIDMRFAQREAVIRGALESRSPEVREYALGLLKKCYDRVGGNFFAEFDDMKRDAARHRECSRASKLCLSGEGCKLLYQEAKNLEVSQAVTRCDLMFQGIEYAAGVREGPVPDEVKEHFQNVLLEGLNMDLVRQAQTTRAPERIEVEFQNLEHKMLHKAFAHPPNWGRSPEELQELAENMNVDLVSADLPPYAMATAGRVIGPAFERCERTSGGRFSRGDLIIVDGKTVREAMRDEFAASGAAGSFDDYYRQNVNQKTNELVAAGLMAGKRVETFVPGPFGEIPKEPTQITKTGYEPTPLRPVYLNAWERFFSKRGFYKEKTARAEEYARLSEGRNRAREKALAASDAAAQDRVDRIKAVVHRHEVTGASSPEVKDLFFGPILARHEAEIQQAANKNEHLVEKFAKDGGVSLRQQFNGKSCYNSIAWDGLSSIVSRQAGGTEGAYCGFARSEAVETCVAVMAAQGHKFQDIVNPNKLQAERTAAVNEFMEHALRNDQDWLGRTFYKGYKALLPQAEEITRGVDLASDAGMAALSEAENILHCAFGLSQMLKIDKCKEGYLLEAIADKNGDLERGSLWGEALDDKVNEASLCAMLLYDGLPIQAKLADPAAVIEPQDKVNLATAKMVQSTLRPGSSILDSAPPKDFIGGFRPAAQMTDGPNSVGAVFSTLLAPENRAATARAAASGKLLQALNVHVCEIPFLNPDGSRYINNGSFRDAMVRGPDGKLVKERVTLPREDTVPVVAFALGEKAPEPPEVQETARQMAQYRAKRQASKQKQPPQVPGLGR